MTNYRRLTLIGALFYLAVGNSSPLITLYLEALGASYADISLILTSFVAVMILSSFGWGKLADRLGRRKPLLLAGLLVAAAAFYALSRAGTANTAWIIRIVEGVGIAAYTTLSLTLMGDILQDKPQKGRKMGFYRGLGSLAFAAGAVMGGRIADRFSLELVFVICALFYGAAFLVALTLSEPRVTPAVRPRPAADSPRARQPRALPAMFLAGVLCWMAAHAASTSMWPNYMASLGYSKTTISSLWGLAATVEMPAMYLSGVLSDAIGRTLLLAAGGFAIAVVQIGYITLATSIPALFGVQIIRGFGFGSYTTTAMTFTTEQSGQGTRGGNSGLFYTVGSVGQLIGMFVGGQLAQLWGFAVLYGVCAALALASGVCFLAMRRGKSRDELQVTNDELLA